MTYQVKYNGNGGVATATLPITDETNHWTVTNSVYKSGNQNKNSTTSSIRSEEFTLTETGNLSFDWAVSSESSDYLYYTIYKDGSSTALTGTGYATASRVSGTTAGTVEANLIYTTVTKELQPGSYILEFSYRKDSSFDNGLDRGFVKNIIIPESNESMENSEFTGSATATLANNSYYKEHYNFVGWSTTQNGEVEYTNEEILESPLTNSDGDIINLYAGYESTTWNIGDLSSWDTSSVTDMSYMFYEAGKNVSNFSLDLTNFVKSSVTNIEYMFYKAGYNSNTFTLIGLNTWDTSNITKMSHLFNETAYNSASFNIGDLSNWNFSKTESVTGMRNIFSGVAHSATTFESIGTLVMPAMDNFYELFTLSPSFTGNFVFTGDFNWSSVAYSSATNSNARVNLYYTDSTAQTNVEKIILRNGPNGTSTQGNIYNMGQYTPPTE